MAFAVSTSRALVDAVAARFRATDGDLRATAQALFGHPLTWSPDNPPKYKRPEELVISAHRAGRLPVLAVEPLAGAVQAMGQPPARAPSPQGWPDRTDDWLSPDAVYKRVQWAERFAATLGRQLDARTLAREGFGVIESDLGEFIQQLKNEAPYHFVFPCMHLSREEISELFED